MTLTWVVQSNLGSSQDEEAIRVACDRLGLDFRPITVIPFDTSLPEAMYDIEDPVIVYGATGFVTHVHRSRRWYPGAFFSFAKFRFQEWSHEWGKRCLNYGALTMLLAEMAEEPNPYFRILYRRDEWFIRPDKDLKEFAGAVVDRLDFAKWARRIMRGDTDISPSTPIIVAEPYAIEAEWRLFMVEGKVVSGSLYRTYGKLTEKPEVPDEAVAYAEETAAIWSPHPVFVLDVCRCGDGLYVVECGSFNSAGFYAADIDKVVEAVSGYANRAYKTFSH